MSLNVLGNDEREPRRSRPVQINQEKSLVLPIILIMGAILIGALWFTQAEPVIIPACPVNTLTCPEIPACPTLVCNPVIVQNSTCSTNLTNTSECLAYAKTTDQYLRLTLANASNTNQNLTYNMTFNNVSYSYTNMNWTYINETIGNNVTFVVNITG